MKIQSHIVWDSSFVADPLLLRHVYLFIDVITRLIVPHKFMLNWLFKLLDWNKHLEAAAATATLLKIWCSYLTLQSANHTVIRVISTPTVPYNTPLVWYTHLVFMVYIQLVATGEIILYCKNVSSF